MNPDNFIARKILIIKYTIKTVFPLFRIVHKFARRRSHRDDIKFPRQLNPHDLYNVYYFLQKLTYMPTQLVCVLFLGINISQQNYFLLHVRSVYFDNTW